MRALLCFLLSVSLFPMQSQQTQSSPANAQSQGQAAPPTMPPLAFGLEDGTPVKLRITRTISSEDGKVGDVVDFENLGKNFDDYAWTNDDNHLESREAVVQEQNRHPTTQSSPSLRARNQ